MALPSNAQAVGSLNAGLIEAHIDAFEVGCAIGGFRALSAPLAAMCAGAGRINGCDPELFALKYALAKVSRYAEICNRDRTQSKFLLGWINRTLKELT